MLENKFQANLIKELKKLFPGCIVMKNDASYIQGIPDLLILYNDKWASLECKQQRKNLIQLYEELFNKKISVISRKLIVSDASSLAA